MLQIHFQKNRDLDAVGIVVVGVDARCLAGLAQVKPGDFITADNAAKVQDLVSPGVYYKVSQGMSMKIIPSERIDWPPPYRDATEKYSGQVRLSNDHRSVIGYVAGQPFPLIDTNDPYVANKIIWNNVFRPITTDDYDLRFYDCKQPAYESAVPRTRQVEYFQIGHYAGYDLVERTEVEPLPIDPGFQKRPIGCGCSVLACCWRRKTFMVPASSAGVISMPIAAMTSGRWMPACVEFAVSMKASCRRRPERRPGIPIITRGSIPKTEEYNYKFLGEKNLLACVNAAYSPEVHRVPPTAAPARARRTGKYGTCT